LAQRHEVTAQNLRSKESQKLHVRNLMRVLAPQKRRHNALFVGVFRQKWLTKRMNTAYPPPAEPLTAQLLEPIVCCAGKRDLVWPRKKSRRGE
jgi:hypothetical protein